MLFFGVALAIRELAACGLEHDKVVFVDIIFMTPEETVNKR